MSDDFILTLTHATERDIDLILVEEAYSSPKFVAWLAGCTGLPTDFESSKVLHSKRRTRNRREIDIFIEMHRGSGKTSALLIENKLDASEQPDQAESYREEIEKVRPDYSAVAMLIVCPREYSSQYSNFTGKFDAVVTYEDLSAYFLAEARKAPQPWAMRLLFRREVIDQAIGKHRRGYTPVPNSIIGDFNAKYVALLGEVAPSIKPGPTMLKPANPDESTSMIFDHKSSLARLPDGVRPKRFAHELGRGQSHRANYVAVTFGGWGFALPAIKERLEQDAREIGASFSAERPTKVRPNPGLVMSCATEPVDNQGDFVMQRWKLISGIKKAEVLRDWLFANVSILEAWKTLAERYRNER